jgi:hypothetical protein
MPNSSGNYPLPELMDVGHTIQATHWRKMGQSAKRHMKKAKLDKEKLEGLYEGVFISCHKLLTDVDNIKQVL